MGRGTPTIHTRSHISIGEHSSYFLVGMILSLVVLVVNKKHAGGVYSQSETGEVMKSELC